MEYIIKYKRYFILGFIFLILFVLGYLFFNTSENNNEVVMDVIKTTKKTTSLSANHLFVDVKGAVRSPGVYEFKNGDKVIDAINMAGGTTKSAVTSNINLSQMLKNEMVIYIFKSSELKQNNYSITTTVLNDAKCKCETIEVNNCITNDSKKESDSSTSSNENVDNKVNINTANESELMSISGIGESKAKSIINYRNENGNYNSIEDIKNVNGIGDSLFEKIKDYITV